MNASGENYRKTCLLCEEESFKDVYGKQHFLIKCRNCGLVTTRLVPTIEELKVFYDGYHTYQSVSELTIARYNEILDTLEEFRITNNLLEAGCGFGFFLEEARKRNWNVYGTELSSNAIEECRRKDLFVSDDIDNIISSAKVSFDAVVSLEVLEHLLNPVHETEKYASILRQNGIVYITTPNINSFSRRLLGRKWNVLNYPEHINYFALRTIRKLLNKYGMLKIKEQTSGFSPARVVYAIRSSNKKESSKTLDYDYNEKDRELRDAIEKTIILRLLKKIINLMLTFFGSGDTLKVLYQKK